MFKSIVWATDGSEHADRALDYATQIAQRDGASLHVVHIVEKFLGSRTAGQDQHVDEPEIEGKIEQQAVRVRSEQGLQTHVHMPSTAGSVAKLIAEISERVGADLIVVGTRGHSVVAGAILGSVTQHLLHVAHCPVLAVPPLGQRAAGAKAADTMTTPPDRQLSETGL
jgi:nucleotide-binding universal stress UspA family protein